MDIQYALAYAIWGLWLVMILYWVASAWGNKRTVYRYNRVARILFLIALFVVIWCEDFLPREWRHRLFPATLLWQCTGVGILALGVVFAIWARRTLGRNWSGIPTLKEGHELIRTGPYRWVRHPIYTGILMGFAGTLVANGHYRDLVTVSVILLGLYLKMRVEESLMLKQFPEAYPDYMRSTRRLVPGIW